MSVVSNGTYNAKDSEHCMDAISREIVSKSRKMTSSCASFPSCMFTNKNQPQFLATPLLESSTNCLHWV